MSTFEQIRAKLAPLEPSLFELTDDSGKHIGHAGAASGGGHYRLTIVSEQFAGKNLIARHRMVYALLGEMMQQQIHALAITAMVGAEADKSNNP